jgi:thiol:disulfide interchange protein DsbD
VAVKLGYRNVFREPRGFPEWQKMELPVDTSPTGVSGSRPYAPGPLYGWAMLWTLLGLFAGGAALNLTPCIYPLIPVTLSYFGGRAAGEGRTRGGLFLHGLCYILGLATTNSALGVVAALGGGLVGSMLQSPVVLLIISAVLIAFAASLFGLYDLRLPAGLTRAAAKSHTGYFGTLFMGLTLGVIAAPCIGPFVLGLLTWVAGTGSPLLGFLVFFVLSLGLGLPLFILAVFSGQVKRLPRSGEWMLWVRKLMGWVLVGMAAHFIRPVLSEHSGIVLLAVVAAAAGLHLGWIEKSQAAFRAFPWIKAVAGITGLAVSAFLIASWAVRGPSVAWEPYSEEILNEARARNKPVILDFYAAWCAPCRELDEATFRDPAVVSAAQANFVMVKVDLTSGGGPMQDRLLQQHAVRGVPTVVFLDVDGNERREMRLVDYAPPAEFLSRMAALRKAEK